MGAVSVAASKQNVEDMVEIIHAKSPLIKIVLTTCPNDASGFDVDLYNDAVEEVYNERLALGRNVYFLDVDAFPSAIAICADNIHPTASGNETLGNEWFDAMKTMFPINSQVDHSQGVGLDTQLFRNY
jgi:hypothetical protein